MPTTPSKRAEKSNEARSSYQERFHNKSAFALAGIPPAIPSTRNAFAEEGMADVEHHVRSNAFAALAMNDRNSAPHIAYHPSLRPRGYSIDSLRPQLVPASQRAVTPTLRDAIELKDARHRAAVAESMASASPEKTAVENVTNTPRRSVKGIVTPIRNLFRGSTSRKTRTPKSGYPQIARPGINVPEMPVDPAALHDAKPPTPPAKNTPPVPERYDSIPAGIIHIAYPALRQVRSVEQISCHIDEESGGYLPHFGASPSHAERSATRTELVMPFETSHHLSPTAYSVPSAAPSPLRIAPTSTNTSPSKAAVSVYNTSPAMATPALRHKGAFFRPPNSPDVTSVTRAERNTSSSIFNREFEYAASSIYQDDGDIITTNESPYQSYPYLRNGVSNSIAPSDARAELLVQLENRIEELENRNREMAEQIQQTKTDKKWDAGAAIKEIMAMLRADHTKAASAVNSSDSEVTSDGEHTQLAAKSEDDATTDQATSGANKEGSSKYEQHIEATQETLSKHRLGLAKLASDAALMKREATSDRAALDKCVHVISDLENHVSQRLRITSSLTTSIERLIERVSILEERINVLRQCDRAINEMYMRSAAMVKAWEQMTGTGDDTTSTAPTSATASNGTSTPDTQNRRSAQPISLTGSTYITAPLPRQLTGRNARESDRARLSSFDATTGVPVNFVAFFDLMVDLQGRLRVLENTTGHVRRRSRNTNEQDAEAVAGVESTALAEDGKERLSFTAEST